MTSRYRLSPEAQSDITQIRDYYVAEAGSRVARYVLAELTNGLRLLALHPGTGHSRPDLTDEPLKFWAVLSYLIVYDPASRPIGIARILHGNRDLVSLLAPRAR